MRRLALLLAAGLLLAQGAALAQERERSRAPRQDVQPRERDRDALRRERAEPRERQREQRFTPQERDKLRQDLLDANRDLRKK